MILGESRGRHPVGERNADTDRDRSGPMLGAQGPRSRRGPARECLGLEVDFPQWLIGGDTRSRHGEPHFAEGVPPPPGPTRRLLRPYGLATCLGSVEAQSEVEAEYSATVLRAI